MRITYFTVSLMKRGFQINLSQVIILQAIWNVLEKNY